MIIMCNNNVVESEDKMDKKKFDELTYEDMRLHAEELGYDNVTFDQFKAYDPKCWADVYLEKCEESKMETSAIKFYIGTDMALKEWRRFGTDNGLLKTIEAKREIIKILEDDYRALFELLENGYKWRCKLRMPIPFYIDKALEGDLTYFEKA